MGEIAKQINLSYCRCILQTASQVGMAPTRANHLFLMTMMASAVLMSGCANSLYQLRLKQSQAKISTPNSSLPYQQNPKLQEETASSAHQTGENPIPPFSPCYQHYRPGEEIYCYRWVEEGQVSISQVLILSEESGGDLIALTPLGDAAGRWFRLGDARLETSDGRKIICDGKETASKALGYESPEGFCQESPQQ